ncbi:MAG: DUF2027 domain-containing protein [Muribaculaceae bacterium]|nr:DUF2027 domain-containing protein [Muribaculaceae bacterium]
MAKIGDRIRFLNSTGGGVITKIEGKTAYVEDDDGFETPYLLKDLVVVLPAGHEAAVKGSNIMFDQKAFDAGRKSEEPVKEKKDIPAAVETPDLPPEETPHGDTPNLILAFEPNDVKRLSSTKFAAVLVNDSNFYLDFSFLRRSSDERGWTLIYSGSVNPNELIDMAVLTHETLPEYEKIAFQCIAYKKDKAFSLMPPVSVVRKLDLTKFHKFHCFRESKYFDNPVLEFPLVSGGLEVKPLEVDAGRLRETMTEGPSDRDLKKELAKKYNVDSGRKAPKPVENNSPYKKLPLIEVDLHIGELTDTTAGMEPKDMLELQLSVVRKTMAAHSRRQGQKIVFIHGKGEGVLRKAVLELLKKEYPKATLQDASFREYGFGATLVTI